MMSAFLPSFPGTLSWALRMGEVTSTHSQVAGREKENSPTLKVFGASAAMAWAVNRARQEVRINRIMGVGNGSLRRSQRVLCPSGLAPFRTGVLPDWHRSGWGSSRKIFILAQEWHSFGTVLGGRSR